METGGEEITYKFRYFRHKIIIRNQFRTPTDVLLKECARVVDFFPLVLHTLRVMGA